MTNYNLASADPKLDAARLLVFRTMAERVEEFPASRRPLLLALVMASTNAVVILFKYAQTAGLDGHWRSLLDPLVFGRVASAMMPTMGWALKVSGQGWTGLPDDAVRLAPDLEIAAEVHNDLSALTLSPDSIGTSVVMHRSLSSVTRDLALALPLLGDAQLIDHWHDLLIAALDWARTQRLAQDAVNAAPAEELRRLAKQMMRDGRALQLLPPSKAYELAGWLHWGGLLPLVILVWKGFDYLALLILVLGAGWIVARHEYRVRLVQRYLQQLGVEKRPS